MDDFELELKQDFLEESTDLLEAAEDAFLQLENQRDNADLLNEIFRLAHNLKGTSKAVGFDQLSELTHVAENLILKLKEGSLRITDRTVTILLEFKDRVNEMVEALKEDIDASFNNDELIKKIDAEVAGESAPPIQEESDTGEDSAQEEEYEDLPTFSDEQFEDLDAIENTEVEQEAEPKAEEEPSEGPGISLAALESLKESGFDGDAESLLSESQPEESKVEQEVAINESVDPAPVVQEKVVAKKDVPPPPKEPAAPKEAPKTSGRTRTLDKEESIRVKLSRIDKINNVIGELVILQTVVSQRRYEYIQDDLTNKSIGMMSKLFKEVQELAMSLRMLPLKATFQKMTRIVRDTSKVLGKDVNLVLFGEETEVDKTVLEKIADPLVHIVRNAVDHGLETPDIRTAAGKDPKGNVELFAYHEGSNLVIQVTDDGKGIDPDVIRTKAIEKCIINSNSNITDHEVIQLIFHPGFSTKEQVTEVSGRGVGMDVVKTNIEALGGEVKLMSKLGQGSSLKIILPLTLAIIEGIVIKAKEEKFVLPLSQIFEISQIKANEVETFSGVASLFKLRGEVLPLFFVNNKIGKKAEVDRDSYTVIVVRGLNYAFGVVVDDILNQQQIVIKKLGEDIRDKKGIIGSAIMSDGKPSLILDLFELFKDDLKTSRGHKNYIDRNAKSA